MIAGLRLTALGARGLRRNGVFRASFWGSFPQYMRYRVRALAPAAPTALGLALSVAGIVALYAGVVGFYGSRFLRPG